MSNEQLSHEEFKDESELALGQEIAVLRSRISINPDDAKAHNDLAWAFY